MQGGYDMIAHHIAATLSIWLAITSHQCHFYVLAMLATEVTTPFVNLRWHLDVAVSLMMLCCQGSSLMLASAQTLIGAPAPFYQTLISAAACYVQGLKSSRLYLLNGVAVFVIWLVGRLLWQLYIFHNLFRHRAELRLLTAPAQALVFIVPPALFSLNVW